MPGLFGLQTFFFQEKAMRKTSSDGFFSELKPDEFPAQAKTWEQECGAGSKRLRTKGLQPVFPQRIPKLGAGVVNVGLMFVNLF